MCIVQTYDISFAILRLFKSFDYNIGIRTGYQAEFRRQLLFLSLYPPPHKRLIQRISLPHCFSLAIIPAVGKQGIGKGMGALIRLSVRVGRAL